MTTVLSRREEEEETGEPEITLSTASLLGLFLGLVLICGVFFGFGYSVGRRATTGAMATAASAAISSGLEDAKPSEAEAQDLESASPSSAAGDESPSLAPTSGPPTRKPAAARSGEVELPIVETPEPVQKATYLVSAERTGSQAEAALPAQQTARAGTAQVATGLAMVQVAAVVHEEDADVLVSALRKRGYNAVVRVEPQDKFLHIQVGPFDTHMEANAMKQKLAADGYDAIVKR
jgi:DedD protein